MRKVLIPILLMVVMTDSCRKEDENVSSIIQINYGTSFGECIGYCKKDVVIKSGSISYIYSGWADSILSKTCTKSLTDEEWNSLKSGIDANNFFELPEITGCPDCADGGAEYVEIEIISGEKHKVTFEYLNEPELLKNYIIGVRNQAEKATACFGN